MEPLSTAEMVRTLVSEGYSVTLKRLEGLLATGRVPAPRMVGPTRAWMPADVDRVREALRALDGKPRDGAQ